MLRAFVTRGVPGQCRKSGASIFKRLLLYLSEAAVLRHSITVVAPAHGGSREAHQVDRKREQVQDRREQVTLPAQPQGAFNRKTERDAATKRQHCETEAA